MIIRVGKLNRLLMGCCNLATFLMMWLYSIVDWTKVYPLISPLLLAMIMIMRTKTACKIYEIHFHFEENIIYNKLDKISKSYDCKISNKRYIIVIICVLLSQVVVIWCNAYGMVFLDSLRNPFTYFGWPLLTYPNSNGPWKVMQISRIK